jgi:chromosome segregation ATPase
MSFPLTAAAAQVENFESLNEGIWVTPEALQNIENKLAAHAQASAEFGGQLAASVENSTNLEATLATANETIAANNTRIQELEAQVAELQNSATGFQSTSRDKDETGGAAEVPYHASAENPFNQLADSLMPNTKKP